MGTMELRRVTLLAVGLCSIAACGDPPPGRTFFERNVQPILEQKCTGNTSGCHSTNPGDPFQLAAGNLDVTSFDAIQKRRDTLAPFGAYPFSLFLIKAVGPGVLKMQYGDAFPTIDVQHVGGSIIEVGSDAYFTLQTWLENGATENGVKPATPAREGTGRCSTAIPPGFDRSRFVTGATQASFDKFRSTVQPVLTTKGCGAGSCHGAPQSDFYITCGDTDEQLAFNFSQAWSFVNEPVADSQLLRVPLAVADGGRGHSGGDQLRRDGDAAYAAIEAWASAAGKLDFAAGDPGRQFFADHVQPVLLTRGCAFQACHSPQASNDLKLRSGAIGFFSAVALEKNYELMRSEFMALEFADARRGRAVAKTILEDDARVAGEVGGIAHRGGPILETAGAGPADPEACGAFVPATASAFCILQEWIRIERQALGGQVTPMGPGDPIQLVYVDRSSGTTAGRLDLDTFQGGADLRIVTTQLGIGGALVPVAASASQSLLGSCSGIAADADIQAPDVSHDGNRIAFAARATAGDSLGVWVVDRAGGACARVLPALPDANGLKIHDFDPAWSPDGTYLVFASTRGKPGVGPRRSRKRGLPQSDLWRVRMSGITADAGSLEQMTVLSNSEIGPQFMREGRVTMTTEKASAGFYQLAGRRINWDLTDYHPLLGQRKDSPIDASDPMVTKPSVNFSSVTDIREGSDGNFLLIASNTDPATGAPSTPAGAGALAVFNRSVGPFEQSRDGEVGYLSAMRVLDPATGYRTPSSLPDGSILVSFTASPASGTFGIYAFNPRTRARTQLITGGGVQVDAQLVYRYPARKLYANRRQLVFGGAVTGDPAVANLHILDAPMLFTLLTSNLRRGRPVDAFRTATHLELFTEEPCPAGPCSPNSMGVYEMRRALGRVPLADDGSVRVALPARTGIVMRLVDATGATVVTMTEEHQLGPGESISMGVPESLFDAVCGGCHGSISGSELDVIVTPDALTGASRSLSADRDPAAPN